MSLAKGTGPFGGRRAGSGNFRLDAPRHILYFDPSPKRVRTFFGGECIADSSDAKLLHETGITPVYYFPFEDIQQDVLERSQTRTHCPFKGDASYWSVEVGGRRAEDALWAYESPLEEASFLAGHAAFYFHKMDAWFEEDEEIFVHPRDPYSRIDILVTSRHVRVAVGGTVLAESHRPMLLFETNLPPRYYLAKEDVRMDLLEVSGHVTECPYKGRPVHFSAPSLGAAGDNIAWCYEEPRTEAEKARGRIAFYNERVDLEIDGQKIGRPQTDWSR